MLPENTSAACYISGKHRVQDYFSQIAQMSATQIALKTFKIDDMKKAKKNSNTSLEKLKDHKRRIATYKFSNHKEDFVITEQEEREGGFFGTIDPAFSLRLVKPG